MRTAHSTPDTRQALVKILGLDAVLTEPEDCARYETDARSTTGTACGVLLPRTAEEVSKVVAYAVSEKLPLVVQGANTGLNGAGVPDATGSRWILSLERLRGDLAIDVANRTAIAPAGMRLSELNAAAAAHGLTFPIDLGADPSLGGMVATNTGGARFIRYGDVRRNVLGLDVVLADAGGTVLSLGAPVWKNNTGLDLKQLFVGSSGAMGIVTSVTLALQPAVRHRTTALIIPAEDRCIPDVLTQVERQFGGLLLAFEGMSGAAIRAALDHAPALKSPFGAAGAPDYCLLVELSDPLNDGERLHAALFDCLSPLLEAGELSDILIGAPERAWDLRHAIPEGLRAAGQVIACDICVRRGDLPRFRARARDLVQTRWPRLAICDFGHVGDGGVHFNMVAPRDGALGPGEVEAVKAAVFSLAVQEFRGAFSAEHGVGPRNADLYDRHTPANVRDLAGRMQALVNPHGLGVVNFAGAGVST